MALPFTTERAGKVGHYDDIQTTRAATLPTTSYVPSTAIDVGDYAQVTLLVDYYKATSTSMQLQVEWSNGGSTWQRETSESVVAGTVTVVDATWSRAAAGGWIIRLPVAARYLRTRVKATGTVGATETIKVRVIGGWGN